LPSDPPAAGLSERLAAYLSRLANRPVQVENLARIPGGASRETYRYDAVDGAGRSGFILRRDPPGSLIETDRSLEFFALQSFAGTAVPVPEAVLLEPEGAELERPFFIMRRIEGGAASSPFHARPFGPHADAIGEQFFTLLGQIAARPLEGLPILKAAPAPAPEACAARELEFWAGVIEADEQHPQPIVRAAIRRLRRHPPPPPARVCIVHGDFRAGNFLHDGAGRIIGVLDWEMAHLGDPLEDLAWALDPLWSPLGEAAVSGTIPLAAGVALWRRASGLEVDPRALAWWRLFASVKGQAIWTSAAKAWRDGGMTEPVLAFSGWYTARRQDEILADRLAEAVMA
jgi:aminoglycoside phosphotransferase (APT) family kinase protein